MHTERGTQDAVIGLLRGQVDELQKDKDHLSQSLVQAQSGYRAIQSQYDHLAAENDCMEWKLFF